MLVKIGDAWIDPLRVEAVEQCWEQRPKAPAPNAARRPAGWIVLDEYEDDPDKPFLVISTPRSEYTVRGVTSDEAARIINRCREQHTRVEACK